MSRGICFIAFGEEYDRLAAHTIAKSRKFISIPITVITNLQNRDNKWLKLPDVNFVYLDIPTENNREIKTLLYKYSPYDETLYVDCDSVFIKDGIEKIFDHFGETDLILQANSMPVWVDGKRYFKIYRETAIKFGCSLPLNIYQGGIFAFKKTNSIAVFFDKWNEYWRIIGSGRDMPSLACAVQNTKINHSIVTKLDHKFFIFGDLPGFTIIHPVSTKKLSERFDLPFCNSYKEFDKGKKDDWNLIFFDDESNNLVNHEWIKTKFDRKRRITDKEKYISKFLPEISHGGLNILDIATGPGEFLELCLAAGNRITGIEYCTGMINRKIDNLYEKYNLLRHREKNLPVIYADYKQILEVGHPSINGNKYDIINCQHAINFIFRDVFNHHPELGEYRNNGEWVFGEIFTNCFQKYFGWCLKHIKNNGVVMLSALYAENKKEYSERVCAIAGDNGFSLDIGDRELNHKFRGPVCV